MQISNKQRGASALNLIFTVMFISGVGITCATIVATQMRMSTYVLANANADALATAAMERAKFDLDRGDDPADTDVALGFGTMDIATTPSTGLVNVTGTAWNSERSYAFTTNFAKDCVNFDLSGASIATNKITGGTIETTCFTQARVTHWTVAWSPSSGEKLTKIQVTNTVYNDMTGVGTGTQIDTTDDTYEQATGSYNIAEIKFDTNMPSSTTYTFTLHFADGSTLSDSFID